MPKYTEQVFQVFLANPRPLRKSEVVALLAEQGISLKSATITPPVEWLFDYRYINCMPGPTGGAIQPKFALNPNHREWPPKNVRPRKGAFETLPIKPDDKRARARSTPPSAQRAKVRGQIAEKAKRRLTGFG